MSIVYWTIQGIGLEAGKVLPFVNKEKLAKMLLDLLPDNGSLQEMVARNDFSELDPCDLYEFWIDSFAEALWHCDDSDSLTFGDDGDGESYLYYPPSMPWEVSEKDPKSIEEVVERIVHAVQKIADMTLKQIQDLIDVDLHVIGCG